MMNAKLRCCTVAILTKGRSLVFKCGAKMFITSTNCSVFKIKTRMTNVAISGVVTG